MTLLRHTALGLALSLVLTSQAPAVITVLSWHSIEGELGKETGSLAQRFSAANPDCKIIPQYKDNYEQSLSAGIAIFRTGNAPALLQVYEMDTAAMVASEAIEPAYEVFKGAGISFDESQFIPAVSGYYTDFKSGHLLSQPSNSSASVLHYSKDAFREAGLNPEQPPKTWQDLTEHTAKLKATGTKCGYASGWRGWVQIKDFSAQNGLPVATENNGFGGADAVLEFDKPGQVKHIALLEEPNKKGDLSHSGCRDEFAEKLYNGDRAITTVPSDSPVDARYYAKFDYGVRMMLHGANVKDVLQNAIIGGVSLWVMQGKDKATYEGVAWFLNFLAKPEIVVEWYQKTGYLLITTAAYDLTCEQGFYERNPGADIATRRMLNKSPSPFTRGLRLGNMLQIRTIVDGGLGSI